MSHRYVGPVGFSHEGDKDRARQLDALARLLAQRAIEKIDARGGSGNQMEFQQLPDGSTVRVNVLGAIRPPIVRAHINCPSPTHEKPLSSALVWVPEGLVITPRGDAAPGGWGQPRRNSEGEPIFPGTPYADFGEGAVKQVIINRFEFNRYPDEIAKACRQKKYEVLPFLFEPYELEKARCLNGKDQFDAQRVPQDIEPETDQWFAHWPEEIAYTGELKALFDATNAYRVGQGKPPFTGPLRGLETYAAARILKECRKIGEQTHVSDDFSEGYESIGRLYKDGYPGGGQTIIDYSDGAGSVGENLVWEKPAISGSEALDRWLTSPGHKANIDRDWTDEVGYLAEELQLSVGPFKGGSQYSQIFAGRHNFVNVGCNYWEGDLGRASWHGPPSRYGFTDWQRYFAAPIMERYVTKKQEYFLAVCINGRLVFPPDFNAFQRNMGAALYLDQHGHTRVRWVSIGADYPSRYVSTPLGSYRAIHLIVATIALEDINNLPLFDESEWNSRWTLEYYHEDFVPQLRSYDGLLGELWHFPRISPQVYFSADGTKFIIGRTGSDKPLFDLDARKAWANYYEYSNGSLSLVGKTSRSNLIFAMDYIGNERAVIRCQGNTLAFPSGKTFNTYESKTDFSMLLYADMQTDVVVDYRLTKISESTWNFNLRLNGVTFSSSTGNVGSEQEDEPTEYECAFPRAVNDHSVLGKYDPRNPQEGSVIENLMPPIGSRGSFLSNGICDAVVATYQGKTVACVYELQLPSCQAVLDQYASATIGIDLEALVGVGPLHANLYPLGVM